MIRPSPEEMLARAAEEEARSRRGRLKVFFGMAPGVGKTYAMLEAGLARRRDGVDVVIGWVETHGRADTGALASQLETLPPVLVPYRGIELREFDLDGALARRPALLLVDELPHSNAPGTRHPKRWQDVQELLEAGIDVYTSLNVQHLESLHDVVAQITGVQVRETVPDALFDLADELELVDLAPDDLLRRMKEGKVYLGDAADRAAANFFSKGNLIALRELAMRRSAERVDAQVIAWRREQGISEPWTAGERLLVAVGAAPQSADLVRAAYRMATRLRAPWIAASVENASTDRLSNEAQQRVRGTLELVERLGGEVVVLRGESVADELVNLARQRNVSRILAGRPTHSRLRDRIRGSLVEALIRKAEGIDVLVTAGEPEGGPPVRQVLAPPPVAPASEWVEAFLWIALPGALGVATRPWFSVADQAMILLLAVVAAASRLSSRPALFAAVLSVAAFDFLFVPPFYTFSVEDLRFTVTFAVMLAVGVLVTRLTGRVREQAQSARLREQRTAALYSMTREFAIATDPSEIARIAVAHCRDLLDGPAVIWLRDGTGLAARAGQDVPLANDPREIAVARWVLDHGRPAGHGTDTLPAGDALHLPLVGTAGAIGVLAAAVGQRETPLTHEQLRLLEMFASKTALALERALMAQEAESARLTAETERLRSELLSAVSHDLRTPLVSIAGAATAVLEQPLSESQRELLLTIREESDHLRRLVADLLDLTRIESGAILARREWHPVEDVLSGAIGRLQRALHGREVMVDVPDELLLAPMDPTLVEQVVVNLLENASKYSPEGTPLDVVARPEASAVRIEVADRGPGIPDGQAERVFERFYRAGDGERAAGTGLGLAICRAILRAHGGRIEAANREGGGAVFRFWLPLDGQPPEMA